MHARRPTRAAVGLGAALAVLVAAGPATAAPTLEPTLSTLSGKPRHLVLGPDGNVWTPLSDSTKELARIAPDGTVTEYDVDTLSGAEGIASDGTNLWVTRANGVATFSPGDPAGAVATPIAAITDPRAITLGPDGNLWTASGDKVVHFAPSDPAGATAVTVAGMGARGIAVGGDGALHIADFAGQRAVRVTTAGATSFVALGGGPQEVAGGPGTQIAVANPGAVPQVVARVDGGASLGDVPMPGTDPFGIVLGNDGAYWTARFAAGDVGRIAPDGTVSALAIGAGSGPRQLTNGPGDTLFVGLETAMKVARISGVSAPPPPAPTPLPTPVPTPLPPAPQPPLTLTGLRASTARISATVSVPAIVRFRVQRRTTGRVAHGRCVKQRRGNRTARRCVRYVAVGATFRMRAATAGTVRVRIPRGVRLRRGQHYRVTATATAGRQTARARTTVAVR
jgi:streptogramin lyase